MIINRCCLFITPLRPKKWTEENNCHYSFALWVKTTGMNDTHLKATVTQHDNDTQEYHRCENSSGYNHSSSCHPTGSPWNSTCKQTKNDFQTTCTSKQARWPLWGPLLWVQYQNVRKMALQQQQQQKIIHRANISVMLVWTVQTETSSVFSQLEAVSFIKHVLTEEVSGQAARQDWVWPALQIWLRSCTDEMQSCSRRGEMKPHSGLTERETHLLLSCARSLSPATPIAYMPRHICSCCVGNYIAFFVGGDVSLLVRSTSLFIQCHRMLIYRN